MSLSAATLELLVSSGLDPAAIVKVAAAIEKDFVSPRSAANKRAYQKRMELKPATESVTDSVAEISVEVPPREKSTPSENEREIQATPLSELEPTVGTELAKEIIEHRRGKKSPLTVGGAKRLSGYLAQAPDAQAAAKFMIDKGWTGFRLEWMNNAAMPRAGPSSPSSAQSRNNRGQDVQPNRSASQAARALRERVRGANSHKIGGEPELLT